VRALVQRVSQARVRVSDGVSGEIGRGLLVLVGVTHDDRPEQARTLADKVLALRVFPDEAGRMNRALDAVEGRVLVVSQFTLYAEVWRGNRPGFSAAAEPAVAEPLVRCLVDRLRERGATVAEGVFGAQMAVESTNDGPVTLWLDTDAR
jgi:D-aminoacyl-tRNA deacylase